MVRSTFSSVCGCYCVWMMVLIQRLEGGFTLMVNYKDTFDPQNF